LGRCFAYPFPHSRRWRLTKQGRIAIAASIQLPDVQFRSSSGNIDLDRAERLGRKHKLRALDAIHIASVILFREATGLKVPFVTADSAQRDAAAILSLDVVWFG
jgi:hypothetical protein